MRIAYFIRVLAGVVLCSWVVPGVFAQEQASNLTQLSLEELMDVDVLPIDVLGSHIHVAGEWMVGYRYMYMQMGAREGEGEATHEHGSSDHDFMVQPTSMDMEMHMMEVMYGVTERFTLMAMLPYSRMRMDHQVRMGDAFTTRSEGIGDLHLAAHYALYSQHADFLVAEVALTLPTGSIDARDDTPVGPQQRLPYPMQLGSGTPAFMAGLTYIDQNTLWAWGIHADGMFHLGTNQHSYRRGNRYHMGGWISGRLAAWIAPIVHIDTYVEGDVVGSDPALNPGMVPTADPKRQGETYIALRPGLNIYIPDGPFEGHRFTIQGAWPLYEMHYEVPLEQQWQMTLAWQWTF